jgi:hypothetical protein
VSSEQAPQDDAPLFDRDKSDHDLLLALVDYLEGPPRDRDTIAWLTRVIKANKLDAGVPGDPAHVEAIEGTAGPMIAESEARTEVKLVTIRSRIEVVAAFAKENASALLVLLAVAALVGGAVLFIGSRALP